MTRRAGALAFAFGCAVLAACSTSGTELRPPAEFGHAASVDTGATLDTVSLEPQVTARGGFAVMSETWEPGGVIPDFHALSGGNSLPPLQWTSPPPSTAELAIVMRDASAEDEIRWVVTAIPTDSEGLIGSRIPEDAVVHAGTDGEPAYQGPDTPAGQTHTYVFSLYALDTQVVVDPETAPDAVVGLIEQNATDVASVTGTHSG